MARSAAASPPLAEIGTPMGSSAPPIGTFTPQQICAAYGINLLSQEGSGQTIAIVDAYDDPALVSSANASYVISDLHNFIAYYGLPDFGSPGGPTFTKLSQTGGTNYPGIDPTARWESEEALDVEWAHAVAPLANIVLVEANDGTYLTSLFPAAQTAAGLPGVSVVSLSFSSGESFFDTYYDTYLTTPSGHQGVTFVASTGDTGAPAGYPAYSPNVLAVGGTSLTLSGSSYGSETGWSGSGGGVSQVASQPSYQQGLVIHNGGSTINPNGMRTIPDAAFEADPNAGVAVYDSYNGGSSPWFKYGGTSLGAPCWAGLIALADQMRVSEGLTTLDGPSQTIPRLYQLRAADFHDITSGTSTGSPNYTAAAGYDLVTGLGTPVANLLVPDLAVGVIFDPGALPSGMMGAGYFQTVNTHGGVGGVTLTVSNVQNAIPGLDVPAGGAGSLIVSGTPTATGTETFTVKATDSAGETTSRDYSITVVPRPPDPTQMTVEIGSGATAVVADRGALAAVGVSIADNAQGLQSAELTITYDASRFDLSNSDVSASAYLTNFGWTATPTVNSTTGTVQIGLSGGWSLPAGTAQLVTLTFHVRAAAIGGDSPLDLVLAGAASQLNGGSVAIAPVDGVLTVFATDSWGGGHASGNFSDPANWVGGVAPSTAGDDVVLGIQSFEGPQPSWPVNDFLGGTLFHSVTLKGGCTLTGNPVLLNSTGSTTILSQGYNTVSLPIVLGGDGIIQVPSDALTIGGTIDNRGHCLTIDAAARAGAGVTGSIVGSGGLVKSGDGMLVLAGANAGLSNVTVQGGVLTVTTPGGLADGASLTVGGNSALFSAVAPVQSPPAAAAAASPTVVDNRVQEGQSIIASAGAVRRMVVAATKCATTAPAAAAQPPRSRPIAPPASPTRERVARRASMDAPARAKALENVAAEFARSAVARPAWLWADSSLQCSGQDKDRTVVLLAHDAVLAGYAA